VQRRAASSGFDFPGVEPALEALREEVEEVAAAADAGAVSAADAGAVSAGDAGADAAADAARAARFDEVGDMLFAGVNVARKLRVDPELALRASADRFRARVSGAAELAASDGRSWNDLPADEQLTYYARARLAEGR
jgi:uncharacterized protein YabN with tetrapyrrole methylase and pyrophosphatase domain